MVHEQVSDEYINFALMYKTDHIWPVLQIKHLVNQDGEPNTPHKLATGTKPSVSNLRVILCPCVVRKSTAHVETKVLKIIHQPQKGFYGILFWTPQHQKGYLIYITSTWTIVSSHEIVFKPVC